LQHLERSLASPLGQIGWPLGPRLARLAGSADVGGADGLACQDPRFNVLSNRWQHRRRRQRQQRVPSRAAENLGPRAIDARHLHHLAGMLRVNANRRRTWRSKVAARFKLRLGARQPASTVGSPIAGVPVGDPATRKYGAALKLFEQLAIEYIPSREAQRCGPRSTCCGNVVNRLILKHDLELPPSCCARSWRAGNEGELIGDVIGAISDLVRAHLRWVNLGLAFIEAFNKVSPAQVRKTAKATGVQPLRDAITTLLCVELEKLLGPSKLLKAPKPPPAVTGCVVLAAGVVALFS
jgi:hypothetical protein